MDSSFSFNVQAEKANAILKHRKLRRIASLFRVVEVCVVLVLISRLSLNLPVAVRNSSEYLRELSLLMNSHRFVFLVGNVIIIALFAKGSGRNVPEPDFYQELVHSSTKNKEKQRIKKDDGDTEKKYPENDGICGITVEGYSTGNKRIDAGKKKWAGEQKMKRGGANNGLEVKKDYRRCETEVFKKRRLVLRRCESENRRKSIEAAPVVEEVARISYPQDEMSNDEFNRTVEAFIARQQRVRREEDY